MALRNARAVVACITTSVGILIASPASAEHLVSVYMDSVSNPDVTTLTTFVDTSDYTGDGCGHNYWTRASLSGPSGYATSQSAGFQHNVSLPATDGTYTEGGALIIMCGCGGGGAPGTSAEFTFSRTWYENPVPMPPPLIGCIYEDLACTSGTPTCDNSPLIVEGSCAALRVTFYLVRYPNGQKQCTDLFSFGHTFHPSRPCT
jgi:hypothetical protein